MKKLIATFIVLGLMTVLIAACAITSSSSGGSSSSSGNDVHMSDSNFVLSTVTISKGSSLNLIDDTGTVHIIQNGTWTNNTPILKKENGAPIVNQTFTGNDTHATGPFNTAGTYDIFCTVHPGMNLTVTVK